jgi:hypothetical protein
MTTGPAPSKPSLKQRFETLIAEYGKFVIPLYFGIFILTWTGFAFAIQNGFEVQSATAGAGTWAAAYVATKLTQPIRIGATLLLTPIVARLFGRRPSDSKPVDAPPET